MSLWIGKTLKEVFGQISEKDLERFYITDHTGRLLNNKCALKAYAEARVTDIHYARNKVYMGVVLPS